MLLQNKINELLKILEKETPEGFSNSVERDRSTITMRLGEKGMTMLVFKLNSRIIEVYDKKFMPIAERINEMYNAGIEDAPKKFDILKRYY
ncbi:hypothetical protein HZA33_05120 [Candidatus Pacearchaeota archaeon]|nr:hypothetical protein [Candidatus Pacearchaeota archaeon]